MNKEIRKYQISLIKNALFASLVVFLILFVSHKAVKYYDMYRFRKNPFSDNPMKKVLNAKQVGEYLKATEMNLYPYLMYRTKPNFSSDTININSTGLRGLEVPKKKSSVTRIVVVGGSAAMGYGSSSDNTTFTALLQNKLNTGSTGNKTYEVINAGLPSAILMQEFILITLDLIDMEPDIVIVFDGFNDMVGAVLNDRRPGYPWKYNELEKAMNISITKAFIRKRLMNYRPTKKIIELIEKKKLDRIKRSRDYSLNPAAVQFYKKTIDRMAHLLKSYGITPVFAYQPSLYLKVAKTDFETATLAKESSTRVEVLTEMLRQGKAAMREAALDNNAIFIDCVSVFNGHKKNIFFDPVHFGDNGQEILAQFLYKSLRDKDF